MTRSVVMGIHAVGKMKMVNLLAGTVLLLSLPVSYILMRYGVSLHIVMVVTLFPWLAETFIELTLMKKYVGLSRLIFYKRSYGIIIILGVIMIVPLVFICLEIEQGWLRFYLNLVVSDILGGFLIFRFGLTPHMREIVMKKVRNVIKNNKR